MLFLLLGHLLINQWWWIIFSQWPECPVIEPHTADACVQLDPQSFRGIPRNLSPQTGGLWWIQVGIIRKFLKATCYIFWNENNISVTKKTNQFQAEALLFSLLLNTWRSYITENKSNFFHELTVCFTIYLNIYRWFSPLESVTASDVWDSLSSKLPPAKASV